MFKSFISINFCFILLVNSFWFMPYAVNANESSKQKAVTKSQAKLELGVGAFATQLPQYLGSDQSDSYLVPLPYIYYLDDNIKIDRNQFNGKLFQNKQLYLDLSASGGIKVNSEDNNARTDMPDLDWVFELGPSVKYYFSGSPQQNSFFYAEFFTRKATATDFHSITNAGWRYGPSSTYQKAFSLADIDQGKGQFEFTTRININFSDDRYLNYYYGVPNQHSQLNRTAYNSNGGYAGSDISFGLTYRVDSWWFASFARYYNLSGAVFNESPLIKQNSNWSIGIGASWIFYAK